jgi:hypothetical protein
MAMHFLPKLAMWMIRIHMPVVGEHKASDAKGLGYQVAWSRLKEGPKFREWLLCVFLQRTDLYAGWHMRLGNHGVEMPTR